jgi:phage tail sheath protein FI
VDGTWSGTAGTVLEAFQFVSQASDAKKSDGQSNYYKEVINRTSKYVYWTGHPTALTDAGESLAGQASATAYVTGTAAIESTMAGGTDDNTPTTGEIGNGFDLLADAETIDVNLLFAYPDTNGTKDIADKLIAICNARKDCMAFVSPPIDDSVGTDTPAADVKAWADTLASTSYAATDSGAVYVYDKYNDVYRWLGAAGLCAGLCANTDDVADAWFSPAGVNRGQLFGVTKLAYNPKKADRDTLYKARVNPLVSFPGQGTMLFGDKTLLSKPSAFDRINVRRLFIVLEKAVATAAKAQLFEFNDEFTRAQFRNMLEPFMRDVKGRRGMTDFRVICDTTNNTGQVIDANRFVADIFIKPSRSINFITLNFIATRTGVDFSEIAGS